jgi:nucleoid-associated protein YgaU
MGSMQQAVLEFDEAVQAPWRPRLQAEVLVERPRLRALPPPTPARAPGPRAPRPGLRPASPSGRRSNGAGGRPRRTPVPVRPVRVGCARPTHAATPAPLRLTGRGRVLVTVLALALGVALAAVLGAAVDGGGGLRLAGESTVVVQPGDTVWGIASSVSGDEDVRAVVYEIQHLNHLGDAPLVPGQILRLP